MQNPDPDQPRRGAQAQQASAYSRKERNLDLYGPLGTERHRLFGSTPDSENGRDCSAVRRKRKDNCCADTLSQLGSNLDPLDTPTLSDDDGSSLLTADECAPVTGQLSTSTLSDRQGKRSQRNSVATSMSSSSTSGVTQAATSGASEAAIFWRTSNRRFQRASSRRLRRTSSRHFRRTLSHLNSSWLVLQDRLRHSESSSFGGGEELRYHSSSSSFGRLSVDGLQERSNIDQGCSTKRNSRIVIRNLD
ncbi:MAG: hypothetical protein GY696_07975 [Gammaproteobacteria bacterium]|nr:hypothetical protein [Gammaproteobacteria bacterium]